MLNKTHIEQTIEALQGALEYNVRAILAAYGAGNSSIHRVLSQAPSLSYTLTALSQMQDLLADMEVATEENDTGDADTVEQTTTENAFARRMREARERKQAAAAKKR